MSKRFLNTGLAVLALATLVGVFALYHQPQFLVTLANQLWACFGL